MAYKKDKKSTVMLLVKEENALKIMHSYLTDYYFVIKVGKVKDALEKLSFFTPDVIVVDFSVFEKENKEKLEFLFTANPWSIIIITNKEKEEKVSKVIHERADAILTKPVSLKFLSSIIDSLLLTSNRRKMPDATDEFISSIDLSEKSVSDLFDDLFSFVLLFYDSFPVYSSGGFIVSPDNSSVRIQESESEQLISAFMNAIQTFIESTFGQEINEIAMGTHHFYISRANGLTIAVLINKIMLNNIDLSVFKVSIMDVLNQILKEIKPIIPEGARFLSSSLIRKCEVIIIEGLVEFIHSMFGIR